MAGSDPARPTVLRVLPDGTYLTALITPTIRGRRRERLLAAARAGGDLSDINTVPDAFDERGLPVIHLARSHRVRRIRPGRPRQR